MKRQKQMWKGRSILRKRWTYDKTETIKEIERDSSREGDEKVERERHL